MRLLATLMLLTLTTAAAADSLSTCAAIDDPVARLGCYDRVAGRSASSAVPAVAPMTPAVSAPAPAAQGFGAEALPVPEPERELRAHIKGAFTEWHQGSKVELDNGQVWKVIDGDHGFDSRVGENPEVTIVKGVLGGFRMRIDGIAHVVPVRRIQ